MPQLQLAVAMWYQQQNHRLQEAQEAAKLTSQLKHSVQPQGVFRASLCQAGGSLQVCLHLVLNLQLAHAPPRLQVVEVDQLIWLRLCVRILQGPRQ